MFYVLIISLFCVISCTASTATSHMQTLLEQAPYFPLLTTQYAAHCEHTVPSIVEACIKAMVPLVPADPADDKWFDVVPGTHRTIGLLPDPEKPYDSPDCNAGHNAAGKMKNHLWKKLVCMAEKLDEFAEVFDYEKGDVEIRIFEALRPLDVQKQIFAHTKQQIEQQSASAGMTMTEEEIYARAAALASPGDDPDNLPVHYTGCAVDLRLWNVKTSDFVDMGQFGVFKPNPTAASFCEEGLSAEQIKNRVYFLKAAAAAGLVNYPKEWWHVSSNDKYARYWEQLAARTK
ncbi:M15 family metallopeptidase [Candidatus Dependentiae bacterium]|nr:M15 family metallopeptidase [Candidatus Dependentiae bacterium]